MRVRRANENPIDRNAGFLRCESLDFVAECSGEHALIDNHDRNGFLAITDHQATRREGIGDTI